MSEWAVMLCLKLKRFRCQNSSCGKPTFVEALPDLFLPRAQRSQRLTDALWHIGQIAGGQGGSRLAQRLHRPASRCTLLRILRRQPLPERAPPQVVGVDDWAKRKGQAYGTLVVDLERHAVLDLLPDREAGTLATWLKDHPAVRIVARDRSLQDVQGRVYILDDLKSGALVALNVRELEPIMRETALVRLPRETPLSAAAEAFIEQLRLQARQINVDIIRLGNTRLR